jgi:Bacterial mobilisation protein (MobC)
LPQRARRTDESRTEVVTLRLTKAERARAEQRASAAGLTLSAWSARMLSAGRVTVEVTPSPALHPALVAELKRIGNNVNQIAACLNSGRHVPVRNIALGLQEVLQAIIGDALLSSRARAGQANRTPPDGAAHPQTGQQLQGGVRLYPP